MSKQRLIVGALGSLALLVSPGASQAQHHNGGHASTGHAHVGTAHHGGNFHSGSNGFHHGFEHHRGFGFYPGAYYGLGYPYYGGAYYSTPSYYYSAPSYYYSAPSYYYAPPLVSEPTYVAPASAPEAAAPVSIEVRVPADAELWFEGQKTGQGGPVRNFASPVLPPGRTYTYDVRARWVQDGQVVDQSRQLRVQAGQRVVVDFLSPAAP